ncbi:MAG TPA: prepilin peptidase, partial [Patescibacteria group bacterium]
MIFSLIILFILGICIGSFLGVIVDRLPRGESIIKGRSYCEFCKKKLTFLDLFPVFSFIFLGGRCRYCHKKLSWYYPLIELLTGLSFVGVALFLNNNLQFQFEIFFYLLI